MKTILIDKKKLSYFCPEPVLSVFDTNAHGSHIAVDFVKNPDDDHKFNLKYRPFGEIVCNT